MTRMAKTITLDEPHFKTAAKKARELGTTPQVYIQSLIDAANTGFDELLSPVRESFKQSGITEAQLEATVTEARKAIHAKRPRKRQK